MLEALQNILSNKSNPEVVEHFAKVAIEKEKNRNRVEMLKSLRGKVANRDWRSITGYEWLECIEVLADKIKELEVD